MKKLKENFLLLKQKTDMKKNKLFLMLLCFATSSILIASCKKDKTVTAAIETYKLTGKIDAARTTIPTAALIKAEFTVSFNNVNSFGDAESLINGRLELTGYTGIVPVQGRESQAFFVLANGMPDTVVSRTYTADTVVFFARKADGTNVSYLVAPAVRTISYKPTPPPVLTTAVVFTNFYTFTNTPNASFSLNNFPFTNEITSFLKEGTGFFRIGKFPRYVFINMDTVTKL